jgi:hypothetical protein
MGTEDFLPSKKSSVPIFNSSVPFIRPTSFLALPAYQSACTGNAYWLLRFISARHRH